MKGKIVLVPFPFTDLTAAKLRPALVIYEGEKDVVLSFISSKIPYKPSNVDIVLKESHTGFKKSGLKLDSVIKLDKIATVLKDLIMGELGELDDDLRFEVNGKLRNIFEI
jgi:mRNA interferase MazF